MSPIFADRFDGACTHVEEKADVIAISGLKVAILPSDKEWSFGTAGLGS